jgi:hypothetical protein
MDAAFQTLKLDGALKLADVRKKFRQAQEQDRYQNGHIYCGFGMKHGITFKYRSFKNFTAARHWLIGNTQRYGDAFVVTYTDDGRGKWLIGAWCAE